MELSVSSLRKKLSGRPVLQNISYTFQSGYIYGIVGQNGSGKTMLLRALAGLIRPTSGSISADGKNLFTDFSVWPSAGVLIEKPEYIPYLTGFENLKLLAEIQNKITDDMIRDYMKLFGLEPDAKLPLRKYSLGMKQKIGIIQALMESPELLLLDEPFNALDQQSVDTLRAQLLARKSENDLVILTSHHQDDISAVCDEVLQLEDGKLIEAV